MTSSATMHWATQSIKRGNVWGMRAGLLLTFLMGLAFLTSQLFEYMRAGFNTTNGAFPTIFFCLTGLHGCHVFVGLSILAFTTIRAFRGHFSAPHPTGVGIGGLSCTFAALTGAVDDRRADAEATAAALESRLPGARVEVGADDPALAVEDALRVFGADEVLVVGDDELVQAIRARVALPVSHA